MPMKRYVYVCCLAVFVALYFVVAAGAQESKKVVVILSDSIGPYQDAVAGFKEVADAGAYAITYNEFPPSTDVADGAELKAEVEALKPDLIFSVGTPASLFARAYLKGAPVVFAMVLNPVENNIVPSMERPGISMTGVCLNIPIDIQLATLKKIKPVIRRIGMLYDVKTKAGLLNKAAAAAEKAGVELITEPVYSENEVAGALNRVLSTADSLWASPDPLVYNAATAQQIILATIKSNTPFMAFSKNFVKAGALVALECDYRDIGRQAGELAMKVMGQEGEKEIGIEYPRRTVVIVNMRTADTIGVRISKEILDSAVVYGK